MADQHHEMAMVNEASIANGPIGIGAPVLHTLGYLAMTAALALLVYEKLGVRVLAAPGSTSTSFGPRP
jgi:hypothetical protein